MTTPIGIAGAAASAGANASMFRSYQLGRSGYFFTRSAEGAPTTVHTLTTPSGAMYRGLGRGWSSMPETGSYRLDIDAHAHAAAFAGDPSLPVTGGAFPYVLVPTADADFPACTRSAPVAVDRGASICASTADLALDRS